MSGFGSREYCKYLEKCGFKPKKQHGTSHKKYLLPDHIVAPNGTYPFVIVVMKRGQYDPKTASKIRKYLEKLGLDKEEIAKMLP